MPQPLPRLKQAGPTVIVQVIMSVRLLPGFHGRCDASPHARTRRALSKGILSRGLLLIPKPGRFAGSLGMLN